MSDTRSSGLLAPFRRDHRVDRTLVAIYALVNAIVLVNAIRHSPYIGYDAASHVDYLKALATGRLPAPTDTNEFFSPPLPYAVPAVVLAAGGSTTVALKVAQLAQVLLSMVLTYFLVRLCEHVSRSFWLKPLAVAILGMCPVYYKTFAFVRGEPYVACLVVVILCRALDALRAPKVRPRDVVSLGVLSGTLMLCRQWGALIFPAVLAWLCIEAARHRSRAREWLTAMVAALAVATVVGAWFYVSLRVRYGSPVAFNGPHAPHFAFSNQPPEFYTDLGLPDILADPIRPSFPNRLWPLLYADFWGDYWCYWVVWGRDPEENRWVNGYEMEIRTIVGRNPKHLTTNFFDVGRYLGRVDALGLLPTALAFAALGLAAVQALRFVTGSPVPEGAPAGGAIFLLVAAMGVSFAGYLAFTIMYPNPSHGTPIKPTYILQIFPLWAVLGASMMDRIRERSRREFVMLAALLAIVFVHELPVLFSRYTGFL